ncbi:Leishmanolysin [Cooperia oncophora]
MRSFVMKTENRGLNETATVSRFHSTKSLAITTGIAVRITTVLRDDWWTGEGKVVHPVHMMVTPRVVDEVRRHFACDNLEGAELENQGGDGTALTHWEKRVFENEAMTGTHTQNPVYSRMTLALLEDSGWYKPNYEKAEELHWGRKLGCEFAKKSCGEWINNKIEKGELPTPFCNEIKHDGQKSLGVARCTSQRDSLAICNLVPYKKELPIQFRNFARITGGLLQKERNITGVQWNSLTSAHTARSSNGNCQTRQYAKILAVNLKETIAMARTSLRCMVRHHAVSTSNNHGVSENVVE